MMWAKMIPENISRKDILKSLDQINREGVPPRRKSVEYCCVHENRHYPPKYVVSVANKYANGELLDPGLFTGGEETNTFLEERGFDIEECNCGGCHE